MPTAHQSRPPPPQTWPTQPGQKPPTLPPQQGGPGQPNFPGATAPASQMYNTSQPSASNPSASPVYQTFESAQYNTFNTSQFKGSGPPVSAGPRGPMPPPPVGVGQSQGRFPPPSNQQPPPSINPGPQTMMNMGYGPPSETPSPYPGVTGQHQYMQPGQQPLGHQSVPGTTQPFGFPQRLPQPAAGQPPAAGPIPQPQPRRLDPDQMPSPVSNTCTVFIFRPAMQCYSLGRLFFRACLSYCDDRVFYSNDASKLKSHTTSWMLIPSSQWKLFVTSVEHSLQSQI
jgi:hypothetical protein